MKEPDQIKQEVFRICRSMWPNILTDGYSGSARIVISVHGGGVCSIKKCLDANNPGIVPPELIQMAEEMVAEKLATVLPQIIVPRSFACATLSLDVVRGIPAACSCYLEHNYKPSRTAVA